ncbi:MAG: hypothetical protein ACOCV8_01350 [Spirochaetota bacterium]
MKIIIKDDDKLEKAKDVYDRFNQNKSLRSLYDKQLEARRTYINDIEHAKEVGLKEGKEVGLKEGKEVGLKEGEKKGERKKAIETAKNLKRMKLDIDRIAEATGLSKEDIEKL